MGSRPKGWLRPFARSRTRTRRTQRCRRSPHALPRTRRPIPPCEQPSGRNEYMSTSAPCVSSRFWLKLASQRMSDLPVCSWPSLNYIPRRTTSAWSIANSSTLHLSSKTVTLSGWSVLWFLSLLGHLISPSNLLLLSVSIFFLMSSPICKTCFSLPSFFAHKRILCRKSYVIRIRICILCRQPVCAKRRACLLSECLRTITVSPVYFIR